jgi:DNA polymerase-3 subunit delta'
LLCTAGESGACGECQSCRLAAAGTHPDLRSYRPVISASPPDKPEQWLTAPAHLLGSLHPLDLLRRLRDEVALRPALGKRRVVIVEEADRMTEESQNCALKTLEEPPEGTILILTVVNVRNLLPTILSRCQRVPFRLVAPTAIQEWLAQWSELSRNAALLSRFAEGRPGYALHLGTEPALWTGRRAVAELVRAAAAADPVDAMRFSESVQDLAGELWPADESVPGYGSLKGTNKTRAQRSKSCEVVEWMTSWYRDLLLLSLGASPDRITNVDDSDWLREAAARQGGAWAGTALETLTATRRKILQNANLSLALEAMFTSIILGQSAN